MQLERDGKTTRFNWGGDAEAYVVCADVRTGETLTLRWPVPRFAQVFTPQSVAGRNQPVTVHWVGNEVRSIEPRGKYLPMFTSR